MLSPHRIADPEAVFLLEERRVTERDAVPWESFDRHRYPESLLGRARVAWTRRLLGEYQSLVTVSALAARFAATNEPIAVTSAALRMAQDELRHAELCGRMADLLGGRVAVSLTPHQPREHLDDEVMTMLCIDESLSLSFLAAGRGEAADAVVAAIGEALLRDEIFHARCGWAWLTLRAQEMTDGDRARLSASAGAALRGLSRLREDGEAGAAESDSIALGALPAAARRAAYDRARDEWIVPGLANLGIEVSR